mmetsp:Transcript_18447/g.45294  ORF Transcript_18447/g.45294 Transcript_18447/m.45294 type:complete len:264 (+) Transcript_18447:124-915(+)|eukprot:CAMPEP_0206276370 /NCGR_PEP_ID=MMETSP0047_2-20121206/36265_1 /ASSEMBLY_ACC=CAM_ASM_000192 /TAXON_ID=195065 /ORGANISM="Chroomonas mesostigmatica_cf, Strain CCMP1168" /LENGTH=263 /DNA_ID=CAMNT_0053705873 /DNA_START=38 /DNA_END=829 /DNA_ORIENTATION=-
MAFAPVSNDQWDHILEAWRMFDTDADGVITARDLRKVLLSFGYEHDEDDIEHYLDALPICLEKDRALDLPEFMLWVKKLSEKIAQEDEDRQMEDEKALEESIPKENSRKTLMLKELLNTSRHNRETLHKLVEEEQIKFDKELFDLIDEEGNGVLTYQDIQKLSTELGEPWRFEELDEMMYAMADYGAERRVPLEKFVSVLQSQVAWDERDLLPCQEELLIREEENRVAEAERAGRATNKNQIKRGKGGPRALLPWYRRYYTVM